MNFCIKFGIQVVNIQNNCEKIDTQSNVYTLKSETNSDNNSNLNDKLNKNPSDTIEICNSTKSNNEILRTINVNTHKSGMDDYERTIGRRTIKFRRNANCLSNAAHEYCKYSLNNYSAKLTPRHVKELIQKKIGHTVYNLQNEDGKILKMFNRIIEKLAKN